MAHKMSTERGKRNERYTRTNRWTNKQRYSYEQTMSSQWDGNNAGIAQSKRQREKVKTRLWIHICSFNQKHYSHSYEWQSKFGERTNEQTKRMKKKATNKRMELASVHWLFEPNCRFPCNRLREMPIQRFMQIERKLRLSTPNPPQKAWQENRIWMTYQGSLTRN